MKKYCGIPTETYLNAYTVLENHNFFTSPPFGRAGGWNEARGLARHTTLDSNDLI